MRAPEKPGDTRGTWGHQRHLGTSEASGHTRGNWGHQRHWLVPRSLCCPQVFLVSPGVSGLPRCLWCPQVPLVSPGASGVTSASDEDVLTQLGYFPDHSSSVYITSSIDPGNTTEQERLESSMHYSSKCTQHLPTLHTGSVMPDSPISLWIASCRYMTCVHMCVYV